MKYLIKHISELYLAIALLPAVIVISIMSAYGHIDVIFSIITAFIYLSILIIAYVARVVLRIILAIKNDRNTIKVVSELNRDLIDMNKRLEILEDKISSISNKLSLNARQL